MLGHPCNPRTLESEMEDHDFIVSLELHNEALSQKNKL